MRSSVTIVNRMHSEMMSSGGMVGFTLRRWLGLVLVSCFLMMPSVVVRAQSPADWAEPVALGIFDYRYSAVFPMAAADRFGQVHVFTSSNPFYQGDCFPMGAIIYARMIDNECMPAIDIALSPGGYGSEPFRALVDSDDMVRLLWGTGSHIWLTSASALADVSAHSWETTLLMTNASAGDLGVLPRDGGFAFTYIVDSQALLYEDIMASSGNRSVASQVWEVPSDRYGAYMPRMLVTDDAIHLTWTEVDGIRGWQPSAVWYARSVDGGHTWQDFYHDDGEGSFSNLSIGADGVLHMVWCSKVGSEEGRWHTMSHDQGVTWSRPEVMFRGLSGRAGFPEMIIDASGQLHQIVAGLGFGYRGRVYHSMWSGRAWTELTALSVDDQLAGYEGPSAFLIPGLGLGAVWAAKEGAVDISFAACPVPVQTAAPFPTQTPRQPTAVPSATPTVLLDSVPNPDTGDVMVDGVAYGTMMRNAALVPLGYAAAASTAILFLVMVVTRPHRSRHR